MAVRKDVLVLLGLAIIITGLVILALLFFNPSSIVSTDTTEPYVYERPQQITSTEEETDANENASSLDALESELDDTLFDITQLAEQEDLLSGNFIQDLDSVSDTQFPSLNNAPSVIQLSPQTALQSITDTSTTSPSQETSHPSTPSRVTSSTRPARTQSSPPASSKPRQKPSPQKQSTPSTKTEEPTPRVSTTTSSSNPTPAPQSRGTSTTSSSPRNIIQSGTLYWIQLIATPNRAQLEHARTILRKNSIPSVVKLYPIQDLLFYRLRVGPFSSKSEAQVMMESILESDMLNEGLIVSISQ